MSETSKLALSSGAIIFVDGEPIDAETAADLYEEALRKAKALQVRLDRMQADEPLRSALDALIAALASGDLRLAHLLSSFESLQSAMRRYESEEGRREAALDALARMADVIEGTRQFFAVFPRVREIKVERFERDRGMA
jgi:hypothetical protein